MRFFFVLKTSSSRVASLEREGVSIPYLDLSLANEIISNAISKAKPMKEYSISPNKIRLVSPENRIR